MSGFFHLWCCRPLESLFVKCVACNAKLMPVGSAVRQLGLGIITFLLTGGEGKGIMQDHKEFGGRLVLAMDGWLLGSV